eukprot:TRINITY_DN4958_c0_g1_i10.p2 TRINITY_DN4958_c0_g1~~TRINITY_DN4958_c0_g1_i10.p2  ORF type:complete len:119 (-),score=0.17 TRINITY_DN4958_c0_g1_i10:31-387(-)
MSEIFFHFSIVFLQMYVLYLQKKKSFNKICSLHQTVLVKSNEVMIAVTGGLWFECIKINDLFFVCNSFHKLCGNMSMITGSQQVGYQLCFGCQREVVQHVQFKAKKFLERYYQKQQFL